MHDVVQQRVRKASNDAAERYRERPQVLTDERHGKPRPEPTPADEGHASDHETGQEGSRNRMKKAMNWPYPLTKEIQCLKINENLSSDECGKGKASRANGLEQETRPKVKWCERQVVSLSG